MARHGQRSYSTQVKPGTVIETPLAFLKPCVRDAYSGEKFELYFHQRTPQVDAPDDEDLIVKEVRAHRTNRLGQLEFLTSWVGTSIQTWEPVSSFLTQNNPDFTQYCRTAGLFPDLLHSLQPITGG